MAVVEPGTVLAGKYRVSRVLGEGGMGVVVAAVHIQLDEPVALKFMLPAALGSPEAVARFLREARAAVKLKSEHVARVSDVGTLESGAPYIVMEYLEGSDLAALLDTRGPLPSEEAVDYVVQACDALAEAHSLGIVHRDLKPANLFLTRRRNGSALVKVLDFGISKSSSLNEQAGLGRDSLTKTGGLMGSPVYMSPEQMKSAKDVDARADIWALGVILYELLGGRRPFESDTLGGLMAQVLTEAVPPLDALRPGLPPLLYAAIGKCLHKNRNERWESVAELARALGPIAPAGTRSLIERMASGGPVTQTTLLEPRRNSGLPPTAGLRSAATAGAAVISNAGSLRTSTAGSPRRTGGWIAGGVAALVVVSGATALAIRGLSTAPPPAATIASAAANTPPPPPVAAMEQRPLAIAAPSAPPVVPSATAAASASVPLPPAIVAVPVPAKVPPRTRVPATGGPAKVPPAGKPPARATMADDTL